MIKDSVGRGGKNNPDDVRTIQQLLAAKQTMLAPYKPASITGQCDDLTVTLIQVFQQRSGIAPPTGLIEPGSQTLKTLDPHSAEDAEVTRALNLLEETATNFAWRTISDAKVRQEYLQLTKKYSQELMDGYSRGNMSAKSAAEAAHGMRNSVLDAMRLKSSDVGRAYAEWKKPVPPAFNDLEEKYAMQMFGKSFGDLRENLRNNVWLKIVERSGEPQRAVTAESVVLGRLGRGLVVMSLAVAVYDVSVSDNKPRAAAREGANIAGGFAGGAAFGAGAG
ncbi:MAG: peptidoglycan-binding domain-containing protein, partial [Blastocatellia bacterium]